MKNIDQVLYIPPQFTYQEAKMGEMAIESAIEAGVKQFIDLSVMFPNLNSKLQHRMKERVERHLLFRGFQEPQMKSTVLQPAGYHHNIFLKAIYDSGVFANYSLLEEKISWVDARDEADVILETLNDPEGFNHGTFMLANEKASPNDIAAIISAVTGKKIETKFVDEDHLRDYWPSYFLGNDSYAQEAFFHIRESNIKYGWNGNSKVLELLLDHKPRTIKQYVEEEADKLGIRVNN